MKKAPTPKRLSRVEQYIQDVKSGKILSHEEQYRQDVAAGLKYPGLRPADRGIVDVMEKGAHYNDEIMNMRCTRTELPDPNRFAHLRPADREIAECMYEGAKYNDSIMKIRCTR